MKRIYFILFCLISFYSFSQRGKNGSVNITVANTIVNLYTPLTQNVSIGNKTLTVQSSTSYTVGDLILIIQMQGAVVNAGRDSVSGDPNNSIPTNTTFGAITNYYNSGNYEYAQINAVPNGTSIVIDCGLKNNFDYLAKVQVIKVPRYLDLTISGAGFITCPTWNGSIGGIAVVETKNNCTLTSAPSFSVTGKGFRGGGTENVSVALGNKYGSLLPGEGGYKGESIAGDTNRYKVYRAVFARGAIANGGGGGCAHNAGGGGGSNGGNILGYDGYGNPVVGYNAFWNIESASFSLHASTGGGRGGYSWNSSSVPNPSVTALGSGSWGGGNRENVGGFGGRPLNYTLGKLFLGGGGGSGDGNNNQSGAGGSGGGMVFIVCYGDLTGVGTIVADGGKGLNTVTGCGSNDGAGGGGGGGTIVLNVNGITNLTAGTALSAKGGDGGNVNFGGVCGSSEGYGPGASGGGGYIAVSGVLPTNTIVGGLNGIVTGNIGKIATYFPPNGATKGGAGSTGTILNYSLTPSSSQTVCTNQSFTVMANSAEPSSTITWYNTLTGGISFTTGTVYASPGYTAAGTYTLYAGICPGNYRQPIIINVTSGLLLTINSPSICAGQTATLTASGATSYTWTSGPTTNSFVVNPVTSTVYTLTGVNALCVGSQTTLVTVNLNPTVTVNSPTICSGSTVTLTAIGASSYLWLPGGQTTNSIVVSPTVTTNYSVTGTQSSCTNSISSTISVVATPTLSSLLSQTICAGLTATFTTSGATTYSWLPGISTGTVYTISPPASTVITVIGANGTCTSEATASLTIGSSISISVNNSTICAGQTTTLSASGAVSYTWSAGPNTSTLITSPLATTIYTIVGSSGACFGIKTVTVTVNPVPSIAFVSPTVCSCSQPTINISGISSLTVFPIPVSVIGGTMIVCGSICANTNYTVSGTNGSCFTTSIIPVYVNATPTISANSSTICSGQTATLVANGATTYLWDNGSTNPIINPAPISNTNYTVTGFNGLCSSSIVTSVFVNSVTATNYSLTIPLCVNQTVTLQAGLSSSTSYTWSNGINTYSQVVSPTSTTIYSVSGNNGDCPALFSVITVSVNSVIADFTGINEPFITKDVLLNLVNTSSGGVNYIWKFCNGTSSALVNQLFLAQDTGYCCVELKAENSSCKDSISKCFNIINEASIIIPNVFTPNGDLKNDIFKVKTVGVKTLTCIIFDRWGLKMYDWEGVNGGWDGFTKNGEATDGSYYYIIEYTDYKDIMTKAKGYFQLFKN